LTSSSPQPHLVGILNLTPDSFSDGGRYDEPQAALAQARALRAAGAHWIELGPSSSRPGAARVCADEERRRLEPVLETLIAERIPVGVDSYEPDTQRYAIGAGVRWINDIQGFPHEALYAEFARADTLLVIMHSIQRRGPATAHDTANLDVERLPERIEAFFEARIRALEAGGVRREQLILDPGMGFFLGSSPQASLRVLRWLPQLRARFQLPVLISVSRKSFTAGERGRAPLERGAATLAAELYAADQGASYIRTHDPAALADALEMHRALRGTTPTT